MFSAAPIIVRSARLADLDAIVAANVAMAFESEGKRLEDTTIRNGVRRLLEDPARGVYYIAMRDERYAGQLMITTEWSDWRDGWFWWIQSVYVAPEARGAGVYRALHEHVERVARKAGDVVGLRLYVEHDNVNAMRVYERMGMSRSHYQMYEVAWPIAGK